LHVLQELLLTNLTTLSSMSPTAGYWPGPDFHKVRFSLTGCLQMAV